MKLAVAALLGVTSVQGVAKHPENVVGLRNYCGTVLETDDDGKEITK